MGIIRNVSVQGTSIRRVLAVDERIYQCEVCGIVRDRDQNSAINIMTRFLSQHALWTGYQSFIKQIDNLRYTVNGKTKVSRYLAGNRFSELVGSHSL